MTWPGWEVISKSEDTSNCTGRTRWPQVSVQWRFWPWTELTVWTGWEKEIICLVCHRGLSGNKGLETCLCLQVWGAQRVRVRPLPINLWSDIIHYRARQGCTCESEPTLSLSLSHCYCFNLIQNRTQTSARESPTLARKSVEWHDPLQSQIRGHVWEWAPLLSRFHFAI